MFHENLENVRPTLSAKNETSQENVFPLLDSSSPSSEWTDTSVPNQLLSATRAAHYYSSHDVTKEFSDSYWLTAAAARLDVFSGVGCDFAFVGVKKFEISQMMIK